MMKSNGSGSSKSNSIYIGDACEEFLDRILTQFPEGEIRLSDDKNEEEEEEKKDESSADVQIVDKQAEKDYKIEQSLQDLTREEYLEGVNTWFCPSCNAHRQAVKKLRISRLPDRLIIHFKRFAYNTEFRQKIETLVQFPQL